MWVCKCGWISFKSPFFFEIRKDRRRERLLACGRREYGDANGGDKDYAVEEWEFPKKKSSRRLSSVLVRNRECLASKRLKAVKFARKIVVLRMNRWRIAKFFVVCLAILTNFEDSKIGNSLSLLTIPASEWWQRERFVTYLCGLIV